jgi:Rps23 Pro-64 3,4-dihydroxylase Tpa1-like proline 4-hydroxylase
MINYPDSIRVYDDFLSEENAYKIYASLSSLPQQWFSLHRSSVDENNETQTSKTWWNIHGDKSRAPDYDPMGRQTYQYLATNDHQAGCDCVYCDVTQLFSESQPPEAQGLSVMDTELSLFRPGDYISQHLDQTDNRVWAFSYSLSVGWRPEWGGVLNCQDPDDGEWYAFPPVFNRLVMMDVTLGNTNVNRFVSEVVPSCPINRLTFSGWWGVPGANSSEKVNSTYAVHHDQIDDTN